MVKNLGVRASPVVPVAGAELGVEGFPLFVNRHIAVLVAPLADRSQPRPSPLVHRSSGRLLHDSWQNRQWEGETEEVYLPG